MPPLKEITEAKYEFALFQKIKEFVFEKQYDELELKMKLLYRIENNAPTFMLEGGHNSIMNITKASVVRFATCGFAVNTKLFDVDSVFNLGGVGVVICNTNNPDGFIFNILRLELLPSKRQQEVIDIIRIGIHDGYRKFLIENRAYENRSIYELNRQSGANYSLTSRNYTNKKLFNLYKTCPDLLIFKLFCIEKGKDLSSANVSYLNITELCNQEYDIWSCDPINYRTEEKTNIKLLPYQVILDNIEEKSRVFFHQISKEFDMLFDNDPNSSIEIFKNPNISDLRRPFISFMHITSNTVLFTDELPGFICTITGIWSGTILEKKIIGGSNFIFIGQYKLVVNSDSLLSSHIRELNQNGQIIKICKLANLLSEAERGYIDESIQKFL